MNSDIIKGNWHQLKGLAKEKWGKLTDDELDRIEGRAERLAGAVQEKYGYARDRVEREIDELCACCKK